MKGGDLISILPAGLPGIAGTFDGAQRSSGGQNGTGAFYYISTPGNIGHDSVQGKYTHNGFAASRSNALYGKSNTVQQAAISSIAQVRF